MFSLETVKDSVVVVKEDEEGDRRLVAYVVPNKNPGPSIPVLRRHLAEILPDYMIPSFFVFLDALPHLPNGKLDRRALPAPDRKRPESEKTFVAPRDELEKHLKNIWEKVLKIKPVGIKDNFFDLGGDSIRAMSLSIEIEKRLGKKLPLAILCQEPTIENLAASFREDEWLKSWSSLVPLQPEGPKPPFFCIHGVGGYVLFYSDLVRHLRPRQPVYGLQAVGLDGDQPPLKRVEDMASLYIDEIRSIQPQGPYFLGGFCLGIYIAIEMARQLQEQGQKVPLLVSFNPPGHERTVTSFVGGIQLHLKHLSQMHAKQKLHYLKTSVLAFFQFLRYIFVFLPS